MKIETRSGVMFIGLGHKARQGKDSAALMLQEYWGPKQAQIICFADALKMECRILHGMTTKDAGMLQTYAQFKRKIAPDHWIQQVALVAAEKATSNLNLRYIIVPDVRHKNELAWIDSLQGISIRVLRTLANGTPYIDTSRDATHISETDLDDAPFMFNITAVDLIELQASIRVVAETIDRRYKFYHAEET